MFYEGLLFLLISRKTIIKYNTDIFYKYIGYCHINVKKHDILQILKNIYYKTS